MQCYSQFRPADKPSPNSSFKNSIISVQTNITLNDRMRNKVIGQLKKQSLPFEGPCPFEMGGGIFKDRTF